MTRRPYEAPRMADADSPEHDAMVKYLGWYVSGIEFWLDGAWRVETKTPGLIWSPLRSWSDPLRLAPPAAPPS